MGLYRDVIEPGRVPAACFEVKYRPPSTFNAARTFLMDQSRSKEASPEKNEADMRPETQSEVSKPSGGMDVNVGDFTRTAGLVKSMRLTLNNQIVVPVEEIASGVSEAGRKFKMGDIEQAHRDVARMYTAFGRKTGQWESQARNLEQQLRMQSAKNPKSVSIDTMNRMKSEQTAVRTRIRVAEVQFRRLHQGMEQAFTNFQLQQNPTTSETPLALNEGLAKIMNAPSANRSALVKDCFEIETIVTVKVSKNATGGYVVKFDPKPPLERLYFLTKSAQLIRLLQLGDVVLIEDLELGQSTEMKLADFVKHVQTGTWLLKLRS